MKVWHIMKTPFISREKLAEITAQFPTPFHLYDEKGIRERARALHEAFSWNPGFKEYFAVKATPNPAILKILKEEGCGVDCASYVELLMSQKLGFAGQDIMFSSNNTPAEEFQFARDLGATINLDAYEDVAFLKEAAGTRDTIIAQAEDKARTESARLISEAKAEIEIEKQNAIRDIRSQVAELSVLVAEKIVKEQLSSDAAQMDLVNRLLDEISVNQKSE